MSTILLFPGGMPECLAQLSFYASRGDTTIGASSITNDPARPLYSQWELIPFVADPAFEGILLATLEKHGIDTIFTRHPIVGRYLSQIIEKHHLQVKLDALGFASDAIEYQRFLMKRIDDALAYPLALGIPGEAAPMTRMEMAATMQHTLRIEGQSSDEKILALMEIFRSCPKGDIIEIGSFWGRSACLLALLSQRFAIGNLLCLDPWTNAEAHQDGVSENVNAEARDIDFDSAFRGFQLNLMPYSRGDINFIRGAAHTISTAYKPGFSVTSDTLGTTSYAGRIACLHIDGNHDLPHITQDIADWVPFVMPGGWIVVDDYQWIFGNGPQVAADQWCRENQHRIARIFATGSALFIKLQG